MSATNSTAESTVDVRRAAERRFAALHAARLNPGQSVELPHAPFLHLFVAAGNVTLEGTGPLTAGDAVRLTATGGQRVTADQEAEILVWEMHASIHTS